MKFIEEFSQRSISEGILIQKARDALLNEILVLLTTDEAKYEVSLPFKINFQVKLKLVLPPGSNSPHLMKVQEYEIRKRNICSYSILYGSSFVLSKEIFAGPIFNIKFGHIKTGSRSDSGRFIYQRLYSL